MLKNNYNISKKSAFSAIFIFAAGLLTIFSAHITIFFSDRGYFSTLAIMILFTILLILPPIFLLIKKRFDPLEPIYLWIIIYAFIYLANPFIQIVKDEPFTYGGELINKALWLAILGLVFFYFGYYGLWGKKVANRLPVIKQTISSNKLTIIAWIFIVIGFLGLNNYIHTSGGWRVFWSKPHGHGGQALKTTAYIYELPELMVVGFLLIYEVFIHRIIKEKKSVKLKNIIMLIAASLGGIGIYTVIWGSRTLYSWVIITMIALYFLKSGIRPKFRTAVL